MVMVVVMVLGNDRVVVMVMVVVMVLGMIGWWLW